MDRNGNQFTVLRYFDSRTEVFPFTPLVHGSDGRFYGVAESGSVASYAVVYSVDADGSNFTNLYSHPASFYYYADHMEIMEGANGRLFTKCPVGITSLNKDGSDPKVILPLQEEHGASGYRNGAVTMFQGSDGRLYASWQPTSDSSRIVAMNLDGSGYAVLKGGVQGPVRSLIEASDGVIYGVTTAGSYGDDDDSGWPGTVFRINRDGSHYKKLIDGSFLNVTEGADGRLYLISFDTIHSMKKDGTHLEKLQFLLPTVKGGGQGPLLQIEPLVFVGTSEDTYLDSPRGTIFKVDASDPVVTISGGNKKSVHAARVKITGHASAIAGLLRIQYRLAGKALHKAKGTRDWSFRIALHPGHNVVKVMARDRRGRYSAVDRIVITRLP